MEWFGYLMIAVAVLIILFPVAFIWFNCIGGICMAIKERKVAESEKTCSIDADCPPGHVCLNGRCVLQEA